jgi:RNA polymerase sigma factor (sigma-70 family)
MLRDRSLVTSGQDRSSDRHSPHLVPNGATESSAAPFASHCELPQPELLRHLVEQIEQGSCEAKYQLYEVFNRGIRFQLVRHLGTGDLDDKVHDTFLIVLQAIMNRDLRDPEKLLGYIRTVVRRQIATYIERAMNQRREHPESAGMETQDPSLTPEESLLRHERRRVMRETLSELSAKDREILVRFYLDEMPMEEICREMEISVNQFRLLKSRAKARFSELGQRQLRPKVLARYMSAGAQ